MGSIARKLQRLLNIPVGSLAATDDTDVIKHWPIVLRFIEDLAEMLTSVAFVCSLSAGFCDFNQKNHTIHVDWFETDMKRINVQV